MGKLQTWLARIAGAAVLAVASVAVAPASFASVMHTTGAVNGIECDIWSWTDSHGELRTVALKMEGHGNKGHGGYAVRMTYYRLASTWRKVTINAGSGADGGFGYFVSHERFRYFQGGAVDTIANYIFNTDDSPLGLEFAATRSILLDTTNAGAESFTIQYGHYGTAKPWKLDSNTGEDSPLLPTGKSNYAFYKIPVTTTWVFQSGKDFPRIDVSVDLSKVPQAAEVNFDVRGPYGVMVFDDNQNQIVDTALWGDESNLFTTTETPATRSSGWTWNAKNGGARYNALVVGVPGSAGGWYEMGLFEPTPTSKTALADGYSTERNFTSTSYATAVSKGKEPASTDSCDPSTDQTLPTDGNWPYQSLQYSLPCTGSNYLTTPTDGKKIAWGSSPYYGSSLTAVWNGYESLPIHAWPASHQIDYSVCVVVGWDNGTPKYSTQTAANAALYTKTKPNPTNPDCATATP
jgi:hypothetical protein